MASGGGPTSAGAPARRQWCAAALVVLAIPCAGGRRGRVLGPRRGLDPGRHGAARDPRAARRRAVARCRAPPPGGSSGSVSASGRLASPRSRRPSRTASPRVTPNVADGPQLAGLLLVGSALVIMALDRSLRDDWIARIDAVIVGVGRRRRPRRLPVARAARRRPRRRRRWPSASPPACWRPSSSAPPCDWPSPAPRASPPVGSRSRRVLGLAVGSILLRTSQLELTQNDPGRIGAGFCVAAALVLAAAAVHPSATRITEREHRPAHELSHARLTLLTLALRVGAAVRGRPAPAR